MKNKPLVSIALCTYNGAKFLPMQLESIISQDYDNLEIIIVDDCSGDGTRTILQTYSDKYEKIKLYFNECNVGYTLNFERGISFCSGNYIALCDQDDIWVNDKISKMVEIMNGMLLAYHNSDFIDENDVKIGTSTIADWIHRYDGLSALPLLLFNCVPGHTMLFDRELLKYIYPFDRRFYHDWWIAYVAFNAGKVKCIDTVLVHYRQHGYSKTDMLNTRAEIRSNRSVIPKESIDLDWLKKCADFQHNREPNLINEVYRQFSDLKKGNHYFQTFFFLLKYFDLLFYTSYSKPKKLLSKLNVLRKIVF